MTKNWAGAMPATALSVCAVLIAASGTAGALAGKGGVDKDDLQKDVVKGKNVKDGSLTGKDLKKDSVTGAQVKESTLGQVPSARTVASVQFFDVSVSEGQERVLLTVDTVTLSGRCVGDGSDTATQVLVESTKDGALFGGADGRGVVGPSTPEVERTIENYGAYDSTGSAGPTVSGGADDEFWIRSVGGVVVVGTVGSVADGGAQTCGFFGTYSTP